MPVTKSSSQQVIPDKISQKKLISSNQRVVTRPKMHNQGRHNVPKQLASTKPGRINEKMYNLEFPVSYKVITYYYTV